MQSNLFSTNAFLVSILGAAPTHTPLKYRWSINIKNGIRHIYLMGSLLYLVHGLRATSHTRLRDHGHPTSSTHIGWEDGASPSLLHSMLEGPMENGMQDGSKVYMDSYMASNGSCFMVTWIIFKNHLLEVGLAQNWKTMALWMLTTVGLFYFIMYEDPCE